MVGQDVTGECVKLTKTSGFEKTMNKELAIGVTKRDLKRGEIIEINISTVDGKMFSNAIEFFNKDIT